MARSGDHPRIDRASFSAEYRAAYGSMLSVARAQGARDEADDVVQKAAIVAIERLDRFEPGTNFRAWMAAIVRGVAKNHRRGRKRRDERHLRLANAETIDRDPYADTATENPRVRSGGDPSEMRIAFPTGFREDLRNAVEAIGPIQGACIVLKAVHGHSYEEIAAMLDIPIATARSHVFRARGALAARLSHADPSGEGGSHA